MIHFWRIGLLKPVRMFFFFSPIIFSWFLLYLLHSTNNAHWLLETLHLFYFIYLSKRYRLPSVELEEPILSSIVTFLGVYSFLANSVILYELSLCLFSLEIYGLVKKNICILECADTLVKIECISCCHKSDLGCSMTEEETGPKASFTKISPKFNFHESGIPENYF